jgi:hypothetical protein
MASYDRYIGRFALQKTVASPYPEAKGETPIKSGCSQNKKAT